MEWIRVEDKLPPRLYRVLIATEGKYVQEETAYWSNGTWKWGQNDTETVGNVTHWMPLPDPPGESK